MVHDPDYQPAKPTAQPSNYHALARFYPFYSSDVEQKAWLEKIYRASADS